MQVTLPPPERRHHARNRADGRAPLHFRQTLDS